MRKLVVSMWLSLDGFISGPHNDMSYVGEFFDDSMGKYESTVVDNADLLLLGHTTYDSFASSWPKVPDNLDISDEEKVYAGKLNAMKKIVFSKKLKTPEWNNTEVRHSIDADEIIKWKLEDGKDIILYGSASIVQQLTNLRLIDEYQLLYHPVILGGGKPLFASIDHQVKLKLVSHANHSSGVELITYQLASK